MHVIPWMWVHLLQVDVANQNVSPEEDERNKSYRPLPAKRITLNNARILRWALIPICYLLSVCYSIQVLYVSIALSVTNWIYNEGRGSSPWFSRNLLNAIGLASFEVGACLIAGKIISTIYLLTLANYLSRAKSTFSWWYQCKVHSRKCWNSCDNDPGPGFQRHCGRQNYRS